MKNPVIKKLKLLTPVEFKANDSFEMNMLEMTLLMLHKLCNIILTSVLLEILMAF